MSTNNGTSWTVVNAGIPNSTVYSMLVSNTTMFAGTTGGGVFRRPLSEIITRIGVSSNETPATFRLEQNYPNPFNPVTTIRFGIPARLHVTLTVFNALGQQVATLLNGDQEAGYHDARFDGSGLASGVYFYRLRAGDYIDTKRLILVR